jgi:hypothetical protein
MKTRTRTVFDGRGLGGRSNKVSYGQLREYFLGHELDATMHYPFREAVLDFLRRRCSAADACDRLWTLKELTRGKILRGHESHRKP